MLSLSDRVLCLAESGVGDAERAVIPWVLGVFAYFGFQHCFCGFVSSRRELWLIERLVDVGLI